jgi:tRNA 2-selenouridine synthase
VKDQILIRPDTHDYQRLFLEDIPLLDVRAAIEFEQGAFPLSQNIPLLDNQQRAAIGTRYKQAGQEAAIALGLKLATPEIRAQRMADWTRFVTAHPTGYLYCFRGGLRSRTTQAWLKEQGMDYPFIKGGYKALRGFLIKELERSVQDIPFFILGGLTGSGKTRLLQKTVHQIDLEGLARHRGSTFGTQVNHLQPTPINWENALSVACLKYRHHYPHSGLLIEDESRKIGQMTLPLGFYQKMKASPILFLECDIKQRIAMIRSDYVETAWPLYQQRFQATAEAAFSEFVLTRLERLKKRLGGLRHKQIETAYKEALRHLFTTGESDAFDQGIRMLLASYYDPMYRYQLEKKQDQIVFSGTEPEILQWVNTHLKGMLEGKQQ